MCVPPRVLNQLLPKAVGSKIKNLVPREMPFFGSSFDVKMPSNSDKNIRHCNLRAKFVSGSYACFPLLYFFLVLCGFKGSSQLLFAGFIAAK